MESTESQDLKLLFIQEELSLHGEWLCDVLTEAIEKRQLMLSGNLHESINYDTFMHDNNPGLRISFYSYGRGFEIYGNKKRIIQNKFDRNLNKLIWGIRGIKDQKQEMKKNTRWYAKNMFGGLNRLISRVMYGLSDREIARLKGILENRKSNING